MALWGLLAPLRLAEPAVISGSPHPGQNRGGQEVSSSSGLSESHPGHLSAARLPAPAHLPSRVPVGSPRSRPFAAAASGVAGKRSKSMLRLGVQCGRLVLPSEPGLLTCKGPGASSSGLGPTLAGLVWRGQLDPEGLPVLHSRQFGRPLWFLPLSLCKVESDTVCLSVPGYRAPCWAMSVFCFPSGWRTDAFIHSTSVY